MRQTPTSPEAFALRSAISHARCVLSEPWQSVESIQIARDNIAKYSKRLAAIGEA